MANKADPIPTPIRQAMEGEKRKERWREGRRETGKSLRAWSSTSWERKDQTFHFTKWRAVAFNCIWGLGKLFSPIREPLHSHLREEQSGLADNKPPCDDHNALTSNLLTEQADRFIPSMRDCEFSDVFCHLQVWTDVFGEKKWLYSKLDFSCTAEQPLQFRQVQERQQR